MRAIWKRPKKRSVLFQHNLWKEGKLFRRWREGEAKFDGILDDYAFLIQALLALFEADRGSEWLEFAMTLTNVLDGEFKPKGERII